MASPPAESGETATTILLRRPFGRTAVLPEPTRPRRKGVRGRATVPMALDERISGLTVLLVTADVVAALVAAWSFGLPWNAAGALAVVLVACRSNARVYRRRLRLSYVDDFPRSAASVAAAFGISVGLFLIFNATGPKDPDVLYAVVAFVALSEAQRIVVFEVCNRVRRRFRRGDRTLVVGTDPIGIDLLRNMLDHPEFGLRPVGFTDLEPAGDPAELPAPLFRGELAAIIVEHRISTMVLANPTAGQAETAKAIITANRLGCSILMLPRMHELYHDAPNVERLRGYPLVRLVADPTRRPTWLMKRTLDVVGAAAALVLASPILALGALAVLVESGRPLIFAQDRVGLDGKRIRVYKLRSMRPANDHEAQTRWSVARDPRVGPVGRLLRRTSLDELPQLWNIVRGDMSLVGPRPERPGFVAEFSATHEGYWARHRVPAGLTGLAQVNGLRGDTSIKDRARYDNYYIANWSLWLDFKIVLLTLRELTRRGPR